MAAVRFRKADLWGKVFVGEPDVCWPFLGSVDRDGYGQFCAEGGKFKAHRIAYELRVGPIPSGKSSTHG